MYFVHVHNDFYNDLLADKAEISIGQSSRLIECIMFFCSVSVLELMAYHALLILSSHAS